MRLPPIALARSRFWRRKQRQDAVCFQLLRELTAATMRRRIAALQLGNFQVRPRPIPLDNANPDQKATRPAHLAQRRALRGGGVRAPGLTQDRKRAHSPAAIRERVALRLSPASY